MMGSYWDWIFFPSIEPEAKTGKRKQKRHGDGRSTLDLLIFPDGISVQSFQPELHWRWVLTNTFIFPASLAKYSGGLKGTPSPRTANQTRPTGSDMSQSQSTLGLSSFSFRCSSRTHWQSQHKTLGTNSSSGNELLSLWSFLGFVLQLENILTALNGELPQQITTALVLACCFSFVCFLRQGFSV